MKKSLPVPALSSASTAPAATAFREWIKRARKGYSPRTVEEWLYDLRCFEEWTAAHPEPAGTLPDRVAAYLRHASAEGLAVATLRRQLTTLARLSRAGGIPDPTKTEEVQLVMREIARERGTSQRQAAGLTKRDVFAVEFKLGASSRPKDCRDIAMLLVGRDLLARSNELVSLDRGAVTFDDDGALVKLRRKKTDTDTQDCVIGPEAAAALKRWIAVAGLTDPAAPLFQGLTKGGKRTGCRLLPGDVGRIVKKVAGKDFSGHSLRVGMAQDLTAAGIDGAAIQQAAGWKTPRMLARYASKLNAKRGVVARYYAKHK